MKKKIKVAAAVIILIAVSYLISMYFYQLIIIHGDSMYPTLRSWQITAIDKRDRQPEAGDVIAFRSRKLRAVLVKRTVGCPGDTIVIRDGQLLVNGKESAYYGGETIEYAGLLEQELLLGPGEYAVLGDNLPESKDSRYEEVGIVREEMILGRVCNA